MLPLVLRLLAVCFGTAAMSLWLVGKALVTAGLHAPLDIAYQAPPISQLASQMGTWVVRTPLLGDVFYQESVATLVGGLFLLFRTGPRA